MKGFLNLKNLNIMKKYIKPEIEELNLVVESQILQGSGEIRIVGGVDNNVGYIDPTGGTNGGDDGYGQWAPSRKGSNDEDFGW